MKDILQGLSKQQSMLLLVLFLLEGEADLPLLRFLPQDEAQLFEQRGLALSQTPRKQIVPQLVKEIKSLLQQANQPAFLRLDPEWLAESLIHESPRVIYAVLQMMPRNAAEKVVRQLPPDRLPQLSSRGTAIAPDLQRWLQYMVGRNLPELLEGEADRLDMSSLALMGREDLQEVMRELGFRELAMAFRNSGRGPLTELCRRLGNQDAHRLLDTIQQLGEVEPERAKQAQRFVRNAAGQATSKQEVVVEAGMLQFQTALVDEPDALHQQIAYKLPRQMGKRLLQKMKTVPRLEEIQSLQRQLLSTVKELGAAQTISSHWGSLEIAV